MTFFTQINRRTPLGQRDDALLRLLYNTDMRARELVNVDVNHLLGQLGVVWAILRFF